MNRNDVLFYRSKSKKIRQRIWILFIREKSIRQIWGKKVLDTATKTGLDAAKTASKKAGEEVTGELIGNKIAKTNCETKTCA